MKRSGYSLLIALTALLTAGAFGTGDDERESGVSTSPGTSLTIYTGNLALVRREDRRPLPAGTQTVRVDMLPSNVDLSSLIVLNEDVTLLGVRGFRSYQDAAAGPGASIELDLELERRIDALQLAFLTNGLAWSASYSVIVARDDAWAKVDGYATIVNGSGTEYEDAQVQLLAGTIERAGGARFEGEARMAQAFEAAATPPALSEAGFGDYHLYTVSAPLTLGAGESRRIRLLGAEVVETLKEYTFANTLDYHRQYPEPLIRPAAVSYRVMRSGGDEFSTTPLPGGQVRLLQRDEAGRVQLLGITGIGNTPKDTDLRLATGFAFDVVGTRVQTDYERLGGNVYESAWEVDVKNATASDVTVQVIEYLSGDWEIVESTHHYERLSAGAVRFFVDVAAEGQAVLEYRVSVQT